MAYPETCKDCYLNEITMLAGSQKSIHLLFICQAQTSRKFYSVIPCIKDQGQCLY